MSSLSRELENSAAYLREDLLVVATRHLVHRQHQIFFGASRSSVGRKSSARDCSLRPVARVTRILARSAVDAPVTMCLVY